MFLDKIAQRAMFEVFSGFDESTEAFVPEAFEGRLGLTDRFLSIYNRPTRMRQLFVRPGTALPESLVFQHSKTDEVYIIGQSREDARWNVNNADPYVSLIMAHLVTPNHLGTAGRAEVWRKEVVGPEDDPGWMQDTLLGKFWVDLEYRTSASDKGTYDLKISNYYAWFPAVVELDQWDMVKLDEDSYRVVDCYTDMGYMSARLDKEPDPRLDVVLLTSTRTYNPVTHTYENTDKEYKITVIVPENTEAAMWGDPNKSGITVIIPKQNVGIVPAPDMKIRYQGVERLVKSVFTQAGEKQYKVTCA